MGEGEEGGGGAVGESSIDNKRELCESKNGTKDEEQS